MEIYDNFEFFNPNPIYKETPKSRERKWNHKDSLVRALCAAFNMRWKDAYMKAFVYACDVYDMPDSKTGFAHIMSKFGFLYRTFGKMKLGDKRPKLSEFATEHKDDICIADCGMNYYVCCQDGYYYDATDTGYMTVYSYYILHK